MTTFITAYGGKLKHGLDCSNGGPGAKQSFKDECDINRIMAKYQRSGVITWLNSAEAQYGDMTGFDFLEAMNVVAKGNEAFAALPSSIRKRFSNDPAEFLQFMADPENTAEAIKLGLAVEKPAPVAPEPVAVRVVVDANPEESKN